MCACSEFPSSRAGSTSSAMLGFFRRHRLEVLMEGSKFPQRVLNVAAHTQPVHVYEFGPFRLDSADRLLMRGRTAVPLRPKVVDTLIVLIEGRGRVLRKEDLMHALWPNTFVEESNLTQTIFTLRKALGEDSGNGLRYIETIPRRGYRFVADVKELGDDSRRRAISVPEAQAIDSLAVLPFKPLLASERNEPLELGIADALITTLGNSSGIPVRPISAVGAYGDPAQDPASTGRQLGVAAVLDGSIQRSGDQIRVSARLIRSSDGATLWAGRYTETMMDIFKLQDAIAEHIAAALEWKLSSGQLVRLTKRYTESVEAYQAYLHGRYNWIKANEEGLLKAIEFFQKAIAADDHYALAYVGLADAYASLDWYGMLSTRESNPHIMAAAEKALAIDGDLAEAHAALAVARQNCWDWAGAEAAYRRALELSPTLAESHQRYGTYLSTMGRCKEGLEHLKRAHQLDPVSPVISAQIAFSLYFARRYEEAIAQALRTLEVEPACDEARVYLMLSYVEVGTPEAAVAEYERMTQPAKDTPDIMAMLACAQALAGKEREARALLAELVQLSHSRYVPHFWLAMAHVGLGNHPEALACLEHACEDPDDSLIGIRTFPFLDSLHREPRFIGVLRKMRLDI
jgi:DNA-binding winged helix-turn-helix (wHTH) protein/tetratricopeptide (TPR) repeat protein